QVPNHPFHQALAGEVQLHTHGVAGIVAFARPGLRFHALSSPWLIRYEHSDAGSRPSHSHVLKLGFNLGRVMTVDDYDGGHWAARAGWKIEIRRDQSAGHALINNVLNDETFTGIGAFGDSRAQGRPLRKRSERNAQRLEPFVAKLFPIHAGLDLVPFDAFAA